MSLSNQARLRGYVGNQPEIYTTSQGAKIAKFSLGTHESYKDKTGNTISSTEWHNIVVFGSLSEVVEKHFLKGTHIDLTGKIKTRSYENKENQKMYVTEIIMDQFDFIGGKEKKNA
jgi:single-strand DNA-binding protein